MNSRDLLKIYYLTKVIKQQWYSRERLRIFQKSLLKEIINNAYLNVPFYNKMFKRLKLSPADIDDMADLKKLPIITKNEVRDAFQNSLIVNRKYLKGSISRTTSGSSGFPLTVLYDMNSYAYSEGIYARALLEQGVSINDRMAYFWYEQFKERGFWEALGLFRKNEILYTDNEELQLIAMMRVNPTVVHAFPTLLVSLAERIKNSKFKIRPRLIITHGEVLTVSAMQRIKESFKAIVLDQYGSNEFNRMAWQCKEYGSYHIDSDNIIMEFLDDNGNEVCCGGRGRIIVTNLKNKVMPLIRYETGDYGVKGKEECGCGRGLPMLESIEGRMDDFLVGRNNSLISPRRIGGVLEKVNNIKQYKFIQEKIDKFIINIVPANEFSIKDEGDIKRAIGDVLGRDTCLIINMIENMPKGKTGKIKAVESLVSQNNLIKNVN